MTFASLSLPLEEVVYSGHLFLNYGQIAFRMNGARGGVGAGSRAAGTFYLEPEPKREPGPSQGCTAPLVCQMLVTLREWTYAFYYQKRATLRSDYL